MGNSALHLTGWDRDWLLGPTGSIRSSEVVKLLKSKRKKLVDARLNRITSSYTPWHSLGLFFPEAEKVCFGEEFLASNGGVLSSPTALNHLAPLLRGNGPHDFSLIKSDEDFKSRLFFDAEKEEPQALDLLNSSIELLKSSSPWIAHEMESAIDCYVPIYHAPDGNLKKRALSTNFTFGAIFITIAGRKSASARAELSIDIAHELGHHLLMGYQSCDPILSSDPMKPVYSGVRKVNRGAILAFHAACALVFMLSAAIDLRASPDSTSDEKTFLDHWTIELKASLSKTISSLERECSFTVLGGELLDEFKRVISKVPAIVCNTGPRG